MQGKTKNSRILCDYFPRYENAAHLSIPAKARAFLQQAIDTRSVAPSGAIMLAASAIDAMLKSVSYKKGSLYERITLAADEHVITSAMKEWAHRVRLEANDQRHADDAAALPSSEEASQVVEFARALAQYLFVLPAKVKLGLRMPNAPSE